MHEEIVQQLFPQSHEYKIMSDIPNSNLCRCGGHTGPKSILVFLVLFCFLTVIHCLVMKTPEHIIDAEVRYTWKVIFRWEPPLYEILCLHDVIYITTFSSLYCLCVYVFPPLFVCFVFKIGLAKIIWLQSTQKEAE